MSSSAKRASVTAAEMAGHQAEAVVTCLERSPEGRVKVHSVIELAKTMTGSLEDVLRQLDHSFADAVHDAVEEIHDLRLELASIGAENMREEHLPKAGEELDAVVKETETATENIMEAAEAIMSAPREDAAAFEALVDTKMIDIFEACTFQDITGQRISKVVETLQRLETRFDRLLESLPDAAGDREGSALTAEEAARDARKEQQILNGPAVGGPSVNQNDIDALFD